MNSWPIRCPSVRLASVDAAHDGAGLGAGVVGSSGDAWVGVGVGRILDGAGVVVVDGDRGTRLGTAEVHAPSDRTRTSATSTAR